MKFFKDIKTIEQLKKEYRKLAFIHHPDRGGNPEIMKELNSEYDVMFEKLKKTSENQADHNINIDNFKEIIDKIIAFDVNIEICGSWIWVSGETKPYKTELKEAGLWWARKKEMWYWHSPEEVKTKRKKTLSIDEIREKYGSDKINKSTRRAIAN